MKLQFAIGFSLNLREKRGNERKEKEEGEELQFELQYTQPKKINCKLNYLQLSFLLREKRERRRGEFTIRRINCKLKNMYN